MSRLRHTEPCETAPRVHLSPLRQRNADPARRPRSRLLSGMRGVPLPEADARAINRQCDRRRSQFLRPRPRPARAGQTRSRRGSLRSGHSSMGSHAGLGGTPLFLRERGPVPRLIPPQVTHRPSFRLHLTGVGMRKTIALLALLVAAGATDLAGQRRCVRGIPCGNTCIAANKTCRVGSGTATSARPPTASSTLRTARTVTVPSGALYVASPAGRTFFATRCSAWRNLLTGDLVWFDTAAEATEAGYQPSTTAACGIQPEPRETQADTAPHPELMDVPAGTQFVAIKGEATAHALPCASGRRVLELSHRLGRAVEYFPASAQALRAGYTPISC